MGFETLGIPITFILLASCLLWIIIGAKGWWWVKMICIGTTLYFGVALWSSTETYLGWPTKGNLPDLYFVHWAIIQEPDKTDADDKGAVYLWVKDIDKDSEDNSWLDFLNYQSSKKEPRAYSLPYSKKLHENAQSMIKGLKKGKFYIGGKKAGNKGKNKEKGSSGNSGKGKQGDGKSTGKYTYVIPQVPHFYELPPPSMPPKDPE